MPRLPTYIAMLGLLRTGLVIAYSYDERDQEKQNRDATCDNECFFGSFPGGSCTNDAACICTQQKCREKYFCCMAEKCEATVFTVMSEFTGYDPLNCVLLKDLPCLDSIQRQSLGCESWNLPFAFFNTEAVCGIKLSTKPSTYATQTVTLIATVTASSNSKTTALVLQEDLKPLELNLHPQVLLPEPCLVHHLRAGRRPLPWQTGASVESVGLSLAIVAAAAYSMVVY
ncbi:hypothetical protein LZ30DRAFT_360087 [Colletotrichum cereale]|nr:hypothetical protein LZ30DRAFT_360087 [Colletotrichum cereale]